MFSKLRLMLLLLPAFSLLAASCGGSSDSSDDSSNSSGNSGDGKSSSASGPGSQKGKKEGVVSGVKDGAFEKGSVTVEISGDKRANMTFEGGGYAQSGFVLLNFGNNDGSVLLTFVPDKSEDEGGMAVTLKDVATAGSWGDDCHATVNVQDARLSGEFQCDKIDAVVPGEAKTYRIKLKGKFSAER